MAPLQVRDSYLEPYAPCRAATELAGMFAAVDEAIGQIVGRELDQAGLRNNTLLVFSADNGGPPPGDNTPLRDFKGTLYEGGVRGALRDWPGKIPSGVRIKEPMHVSDWYPTLIHLAGGSLEQKLPLDGQDVWPMLTQSAPSPHDAILSVQSPQRAAVAWAIGMLMNPPGRHPAAKGATAAGRAKRRAKPGMRPVRRRSASSPLQSRHRHRRDQRPRRTRT